MLHRSLISRRRLLMTSAAAALLPTACGTPAAQPASTRRARPDLYACEGCEGALERPAARMSWQTRIPPAGEPGERLDVSGTVFQADGRTPAGGVIIYAYHTDAAGLYSRGTPETEWSRRHGLLRGWVRTGTDGRYAFKTIKPGPYPNRTDPAHIHLTIVEPDRRLYFIDYIVLAGDFGVNDAYRRDRENRGGNGIVTLKRQGGAWLASRNIVLERHPV